MPDFVCPDDCQLPAWAHPRQAPSTWAYLGLDKQGQLLDIVRPIILAPAHPRALTHTIGSPSVMQVATASTYWYTDHLVAAPALLVSLHHSGECKSAAFAGFCHRTFPLHTHATVPEIVTTFFNANTCIIWYKHFDVAPGPPVVPNPCSTLGPGIEATASSYVQLPPSHRLVTICHRRPTWFGACSWVRAGRKTSLPQSCGGT